MTPERRERRREKAREYGRRYRERHPERRLAAQRAWREKNPKYSTKRRRLDPERARETQRAWRARNREKSNAYARLWKRAHPEVQAAYRKDARGRSCDSCDRSDEEVTFGTGRKCVSCQRRGGRNGYCEACGLALYRSQDRVYCPQCDEVVRRLGRLREQIAPTALRVLYARGTPQTTRVLRFAELLDNADGNKFTRTEFASACSLETMGEKTLGTIWSRFVAWLMTIPGEIATVSKGYDGTVVVEVDRSRARGLLTPELVEFATLMETGIVRSRAYRAEKSRQKRGDAATPSSAPRSRASGRATGRGS